MVPFEAFLAEKPVDHDGRRGRAARGRRRPPDRSRLRAPTARGGRGVRLAARPRRGRARVGAGGPPRRRAGDVGPRASTACSHEGRLLLAAAAVALGDRRLQRAAAPGARGADRRRGRAPRPVSPGAEGRRRRSTTSATTPRRTAGSSRRCAAARASSSCTSSSSTTSSRGSRSRAATRPATSPRWSASTASPAACSRYGVLDSRIPPLWETRPQDFPLAGEILGLAQGLDRPLALRRGARARGRLRRPDLADPAPGVAGASRAGDRRGRRSIGCFGHLNESKRIPQLYAAFARLRDAAARARGSCSSAAPTRSASPISSTPEGVTREDYVDEERLWSLMAACDVVVSLRSPTMGETSGTVDPRALARHAACRLRRRLVLRAARRRRAEGAAGRARGGDARCRARAARRRRRGARSDGRGGARARRARACARARRRALRRGARGGGGRRGRRGRRATRGGRGRGRRRHRPDDPEAKELAARLPRG